MQCTGCGRGFDIIAAEREFVSRFVPALFSRHGIGRGLEPRLCPDCRDQRRLCYRNERNLYRRRCDKCDRPFVSIYSPAKSYPVYCSACYSSGSWEAADYQQEYQSSRPFFMQWFTLWERVPKLGILRFGENENSDYTNNVYGLKNCYLTFDGDQAEDCLYGQTFSHVKNCLDFLTITRSELCYECVNCRNCCQVLFSRYCEGCADSMFLADCVGCRNCFGCVNLRQKEYHVFNRRVSKQEFEATAAECRGSAAALAHARQRFAAFAATQPLRALRGYRNDDSSGDNLVGCRNAHACFDCEDLENCIYCSNIHRQVANSADLDTWGDGVAYCYNSACVGAGIGTALGCYYAGFGSSNLCYSAFCTRNCHNLFGCVGLIQKQHCVLNRSYQPSEYVNIVADIVGKLEARGEWGRFLPAELSPFGYNETVAQDYFPLEKEDALRQGFLWAELEEPQARQSARPAADLPDGISDVTDAVLEEVLLCSRSKKPYRITAMELAFYRRMKLPIPRLHPDERHHERLTFKNPKKLWETRCALCGAATITTCSSADGPRVACADCYEKQAAQ